MVHYGLTKLADIQQTISQRHGAVMTLKDLKTLKRLGTRIKAFEELRCGLQHAYNPEWSIDVSFNEELGKWQHRTSGHDHTGKWFETFNDAVDPRPKVCQQITDIVESYGLYWFNQSDCAGLPIYVSGSPITSETYNSLGTAIPVIQQAPSTIGHRR